MNDREYTQKLEKAAIDLLVTWRDREAGDKTQLMTVPMGVAALAQIVHQGSDRKDLREHAANVFTFINGRRDWLTS